MARVEVGVGGTWSDAELGEPVGPSDWRGRSFRWEATPGDHELARRATDAAGQMQPSQAEWNVGGTCSNAVQVVRVRVE